MCGKRWHGPFAWEVGNWLVHPIVVVDVVSCQTFYLLGGSLIQKPFLVLRQNSVHSKQNCS